jgi:putative monooxygenase
MSGITIFPPGAAIPRHFHNCEECVYLVEGNATAEIDGVEHSLDPGDVSFIPAGVPHCFRNGSSIARMRIYWTYASIDATRTIVATGITTRIECELGLVG